MAATVDTTKSGGLSASSNHAVTITAAPILKHLEELHHQLLIQYHSLSEFAEKVQKDSEDVVSTYKDDIQGQSPFETFLAYLASSHGDILHEAVHEDLSYPLSNYFVSSSHNTYLSGNQLSSHASASAYKNVLRRGCRCVEIDVWNGKEEDESSSSSTGNEEHANKKQARKDLKSSGRVGTDFTKERESLKARLKGHFKTGRRNIRSGSEPQKLDTSAGASQHVEPRVLHGYTLTKEVPFREVCEVIRDNAFTSSNLPVIVSLEVHACLEQQEMMVDLIREYWGDRLITLPEGQEDSVDKVPSPGQLQGKILVKVKYTPPEKAMRQQKRDATGEIPRDRAGSDSTSEEVPEKEKAQEKVPKKKMLDSLSCLGIYTRAYHFDSFDQPEASLPSHVFSLSEGAIAEAFETSAGKLFKHNQHYFMRTYPKGSRISSSNLNPSLFWRQGVQIVALNWQKCDKGIMLNEGMFGGTGGWVLKPEHYRGHELKRTATDERPALVKKSTSSPLQIPNIAPVQSGSSPVLMDLDIEFIAAQNIPLPEEETEKSFKPYIKITIHIETLVHSETKSVSRRSSISSLNGHRSRSNSRLQPSTSKEEENMKSKNKEATSSKTSKLTQQVTHTQKTNISDMPKVKLKAHTKTYRGINPDFGFEKVSFANVPVDDQALSFLRFKIMDDIGFRQDKLAAWSCLRLDRVKEGLRLVHLFDWRAKRTGGFLLVRVTKKVWGLEGIGASGTNGSGSGSGSLPLR